MEIKSVCILWEDLPLGIMANTADILGVSLGKHAPTLAREDVYDSTEGKHPGIVQYPLPILKANQETLASIYQKVQTMEDVYFVDFTNIAQSCLDYDDYIQKMKKATQETIEYYGIALLGPKKSINRLSGSLPLLR